MKIAFIGDIILNRGYNNLWQRGLKPFEEISEYLSNFDYVVGNLECIAIGNDGTNPLRSSILATEAETLGFLKQFNIDIVTLAHNHVYDHKESGFKNTVSRLGGLGIQYLGASLDPKNQYKPLILKNDNLKVGLLNYVTEDTNPNIPEDAKVYLNWFNIDRIKSDISNIKNNVDHVILLAHWGGKTEYSLQPHVEQVNMAKDLFESGVSLIVGHHSHTIQPQQYFDGKYAFYSIGNFCYDGKINYGYRARRVRRGSIVEVEFKKKYYTANQKFIINRDKFIHLENRFCSHRKIKIYHPLLEKKSLLKIHNYCHIKLERHINRMVNNLGKLKDVLRKK